MSIAEGWGGGQRIVLAVARANKKADGPGMAVACRDKGISRQRDCAVLGGLIVWVERGRPSAAMRCESIRLAVSPALFHRPCTQIG